MTTTTRAIRSQFHKLGVFKEWDSSAVSREYVEFLIQERCLQILSKDAAEDRLGYDIESDQEYFWAIEGIDPSGGDTLGAFQVKTGGKPKYRSAKSGGSDALFLPMLDYESWGEGLKAHGRVVITEGAKKVSALMSHCIPAVSLIGVPCCLPTDERPHLQWLFAQ